MKNILSDYIIFKVFNVHSAKYYKNKSEIVNINSFKLHDKNIFLKYLPYVSAYAFSISGGNAISQLTKSKIN